jgi:hypothetical protein
MPVWKTSVIGARCRLRLTAGASQSCFHRTEHARRPRLVATAFTAEENALINGTVLKVGGQWTLIAGMLGTRTVHGVKNGWKMLDPAARNRIFVRAHRQPPVRQGFVIDVPRITARPDCQSKITTNMGGLDFTKFEIDCFP